MSLKDTFLSRRGRSSLFCWRNDIKSRDNTLTENKVYYIKNEIKREDVKSLKCPSNYYRKLLIYDNNVT